MLDWAEQHLLFAFYDSQAVGRGGPITVARRLLREREELMGSEGVTLSLEAAAELRDLVSELRTRIGSLGEAVADLRAEVEGIEAEDDGKLDDETLEKWLNHLAGQSAAESIFDLFTLHKLAEQWAEALGKPRLRFILAVEAATFLPLLEVFAPEAFAEAMDRWDPEERPDLRALPGGLDDA